MRLVTERASKVFTTVISENKFHLSLDFKGLQFAALSFYSLFLQVMYSLKTHKSL